MQERFPALLKESLRRRRRLVATVRRARSGLSLMRRLVGRPLRGWIAERYLRAHPVAKLQIGSGANRLPGWLNTDGYPASFRIALLDARERFPFADRTFDYVFSEHHIEHVPYLDGCRMLDECHRVLKPGGRIRVATPDLEVLLALHSERLTNEQRRYVMWIHANWLPARIEPRGVFVLNHAFRAWGHQFLYDERTLRQSLEHAGFAGIRRRALGDSDDPHMRGLESHEKAVGDEEMVRFETMVLEAMRPE